MLCKEDMIGYDFSKIDLTKYIKEDLIIASRTLNYISSQGCVYGCKFCYETCYKNRYFCISDQQVKKDIRYLVEKYNINGLKLSDADFFVNPKRAKELMRFFSNINLKWAASIHPNDILKNADILDEFVESGGTRLLMGIESGNDYVLHSIINKKVTRKQLEKVTRKIADKGIVGSYTFIVGFPGENKKQQLETFDFIKSLWELSPKPETKVHLYFPYPSTVLYNEACKLGFTPPTNLIEWSDVSYYESKMPWIDEEIYNMVNNFTSLRFKEK